MIIYTAKQKFLETACLSATFFTTNPTRTLLGVKPSLPGEKPATNRLI